MDASAFFDGFQNTHQFFLIISVSLSLALIWIYKRSEIYPLHPLHSMNLLLVLMISSLIGARAMHILWEAPEYYRANPAQVFALGSGGYVYFGGALLAFVAGFIYLKINKQHWQSYADAIAIPAAFATGVGRLGCFFSGCCFGKQCQLPWAVAGRHPTQLYSVAWDLSVMGLLVLIEKRFRLVPSALFSLWVLFHSTGRLLIEQFRDDFRGLIIGLSISSWISLLLIIVSGLHLLYLYRPQNKAPSN